MHTFNINFLEMKVIVNYNFYFYKILFRLFCLFQKISSKPYLIFLGFSQEAKFVKQRLDEITTGYKNTKYKKNVIVI